MSKLIRLQSENSQHLNYVNLDNVKYFNISMRHTESGKTSGYNFFACFNGDANGQGQSWWITKEDRGYILGQLITNKKGKV